MKCSVDGCNKAVLCKGLCTAHYLRNKRHGHPLGGGHSHAPKGDAMQFIDLAMRAGPENCFLWPYSGNGQGYGKISIEGRRMFAHRYVCELQHGPAPSPKHHAAHNCGNGDQGCINPHHLAWKTPQQNIDDQLVHGTRIRGERVGTSKITSGSVAEIRRRLVAGDTQKDIAADIGLDPSTISNIKTGKSWSWLQ